MTTNQHILVLTFSVPQGLRGPKAGTSFGEVGNPVLFGACHLTRSVCQDGDISHTMFLGLWNMGLIIGV